MGLRDSFANNVAAQETRFQEDGNEKDEAEEETDGQKKN